jgi:hypothetical protein
VPFINAYSYASRSGSCCWRPGTWQSLERRFARTNPCEGFHNASGRFAQCLSKARSLATMSTRLCLPRESLASKGSGVHVIGCERVELFSERSRLGLFFHSVYRCTLYRLGHMILHFYIQRTHACLTGPLTFGKAVVDHLVQPLC